MENLVTKSNYSTLLSKLYYPDYTIYRDGYRFIEICDGIISYDASIYMTLSYGAAEPIISSIGNIAITTMNHRVTKVSYSGDDYIRNNIRILPKDATLHTKPCSIILPINNYTRICLGIMSTDGITTNVMNNVKYHKTIPSGTILLSTYM